jgi:hypothetical protein
MSAKRLRSGVDLAEVMSLLVAECGKSAEDLPELLAKIGAGYSVPATLTAHAGVLARRAAAQRLFAQIVGNDDVLAIVVEFLSKYENAACAPTSTCFARVASCRAVWRDADFFQFAGRRKPQMNFALRLGQIRPALTRLRIKIGLNEAGIVAHLLDRCNTEQLVDVCVGLQGTTTYGIIPWTDAPIDTDQYHGDGRVVHLLKFTHPPLPGVSSDRRFPLARLILQKCPLLHSLHVNALAVGDLEVLPQTIKMLACGFTDGGTNKTISSSSASKIVDALEKLPQLTTLSILYNRRRMILNLRSNSLQNLFFHDAGKFVMLGPDIELPSLKRLSVRMGGYSCGLRQKTKTATRSENIWDSGIVGGGWDSGVPLETGPWPANTHCWWTARDDPIQFSDSDMSIVRGLPGDCLVFQNDPFG